MKKILFLLFIVSIVFTAFAQQKQATKRTHNIVFSDDYFDVEKPIQQSSNIAAQPLLKGTNEIERIYIGKSANIYSVLLQEQRCLSYNPQLGLTSFTFRTDPETYPEALNSGNIITANSIDGESWSETWLMQTDNPCRYPSGGVYNPDGNTDPEQAFIAAVGPIFDNNQWESNFFASSKVNGEEATHEVYDMDASYSGFQGVRNGLQICDNGVAHIVGPKWQNDGNNYATEFNMNSWYGEFDGSEFSWDEIDVEVDLAYRSDGTTKNFWTFGNAWSDDGAVGYMWLVGQLDDMIDDGGYQPIVFRSTDDGDSWDLVEIHLADNEVLSEYLLGTAQNTGPVWPYCSELAGTVDKNGDLQMFISATATFSTHPDSINYIYTNEIDYIFNLEINEEGVQNVMFVDSVLAEYVADDSEYAFGAVGWDSRMQVSKSPNEDAVFVVWTDTENPDSYDGANGAPNIKVAGKHIGGSFTDFPVTNFTKEDLYAGFYFYMYVSQHTYIIDEGGSPYIHIPITTSVTPVEYANDNDLAPITHSYVKGIKYLWTVGTNEMEFSSNIEVSQNQPNPFSKSTIIEVKSQTQAPVYVSVSNLMGQEIYSFDAGIIHEKMNINLSANNLESGIYFYTIRIGEDKISKKMIIK
jgi:hypothetical protein